MVNYRLSLRFRLSGGEGLTFIIAGGETARRGPRFVGWKMAALEHAGTGPRFECGASHFHRSAVKKGGKRFRALTAALRDEANSESVRGEGSRPLSLPPPCPALRLSLRCHITSRFPSSFSRAQRSAPPEPLNATENQGNPDNGISGNSY